jgi:putative membrane protein
MHRMGARLLALGLLVLAAGCARQEAKVASVPQPRAPMPQSVPQDIAPGAAVTPAAYIASASSIELFEILSSELALQRARTRRVREFAQMILDTHKGASLQLSLAGRRLNLLPSATLSPSHQAMLDQLRLAPDFDGLYRRQQLAVHQDALRIHGNYAALGASPTLRPVAQSMVPVFRRYLRLLRYL